MPFPAIWPTRSGRSGIHFVAATPEVRAFVGYYPTVRDEPPTELRPRTPWDAARTIRCPSIVLYGAHDQVTPVPIQGRMWSAFLANGQRLEWHFFEQFPNRQKFFLLFIFIAVI